MDSIIRQWIERSEYDFETARSLLESGRYLYVAFMCQQSIEKLLKGYIASRGQIPPFLHNLGRLAEEAGLITELSDDFQHLLADLNSYYIKARYGEYKSSLSRVCTKEKATLFSKETENFKQWLKPRIK